MTKDSELDFAPDTIAKVRAMWGENETMTAIAVATSLTLASVQKIARLLPLPYRDQKIVERIRMRRKLHADFHAVADRVDDSPIYVTPHEAKTFADDLGTPWTAHRSDLAPLNAELARRGQRPVWVLGMPL